MMPGEGVLSRRQNERSESERGGSAGFACGGGAEPQYLHRHLPYYFISLL